METFGVIFRLLPSTIDGSKEVGFQYLTTMLVNDSIAIDAGSIGFYSSPEEQARVRHLFLTHTHMDHLASLPIFLENIFTGSSTPVVIHAQQVVIDCLQRDLFNDRIWPDFIALSKIPQSRFVEIRVQEPGDTVEVDGVKVTPVMLNHVVPTVAYILEDASSTVAFITDTTATNEIWEKLNQVPNLKAIFLEVTFPNEMEWLANVSKHLTPQLFASELRKLKKQVPVYVVHLKGRFHKQVEREVLGLGLPNVNITQFLREYRFS